MIQSRRFNFSTSAAKPQLGPVLEESLLVLFLVDGDFDVYMVRDSIRDGTTIDGLQPLVTIVLFSKFVVFALERRRSVNSLDAARVTSTPTQKIGMLATALE
jgi:hypothetical protein